MARVRRAASSGLLVALSTVVVLGGPRADAQILLDCRGGEVSVQPALAELSAVIDQSVRRQSTPSAAGQTAATIGSNALAFGKGVVKGFATGVAVTAAMTVLAATAPAWVTTAVTVGTVALGAYGAYRLATSWNGMSSRHRWETAGAVVGGLLSATPPVTRTVQMGVSGAMTRLGIGARGGLARVPTYPKPTRAQLEKVLAESKRIAQDDALLDAVLAAAKKNGGSAPPTQDLAFTTLTGDDTVLLQIAEKNLLSGRALGRPPGPNADAIWFKEGTPFYGEGITLVIPKARLMEYGAVESVGLAGQSGVIRVPHEAVPGGIPIGEFAIVESIGRGFVKPLYTPPGWKGPIGPTLP